MRVLLDTHLLVWIVAGDPRAEALRDLIDDPASDVGFSVASLWEIGIKRALERPDFRVEPAALRHALISAGYMEVPVTGEHALAAPLLPPIHKDPFDRMIVAQALVEDRVLLTSDDAVIGYPGDIRHLRQVGAMPPRSVT